MLLVGIQENEGWILSRWNLTYATGWEGICKAVAAVYDSYNQPEILAGDRPVDVNSKEDIFKIVENRDLTIRGIAKIIKAPMMITFINQTKIVDVNVAKLTEEFVGTNYEKFNMSLCQYMDSIELAMYR